MLYSTLSGKGLNYILSPTNCFSLSVKLFILLRYNLDTKVCFYIPKYLGNTDFPVLKKGDLMHVFFDTGLGLPNYRAGGKMLYIYIF